MRSRGTACVAVCVLLILAAIPSPAAAQAAWPSVLVALEDGHRPGLEELPRLAAALASAPEEVLVAWDGNGHFLFHAVGDGHVVRIPRRLVRRLEGSIVIHNHPRGSPPSARDLDTVLRYGLQRLFVAASVDGVVSLTEVTPDSAIRQLRQGGGPMAEASWRPVVDSSPMFAIGGRELIAAQIAYSLLGDLL